MSNETDKAAIANIALLAIGQDRLTTLSDNTPHAKKINAIFEEVVKNLMDDDWFFSRKKVLLSDLTAVHKLTVDTAPTPSAFYAGGTLTGASSGVTCEVIEPLSDTVYLVTEPSGDFTDGEVIGDGTNSVDCATGYPDVDDTLAYGLYDYGYKKPTDLLNLRGIGDYDFDEKLKYPYDQMGQIVLTNRTSDWLHYNKYVGYQGSLTVSDVTNMPLWFRRLISARLAYILAPNVTENMKQKQKVELELKDAWLNAKERNGSQCYFEGENGSPEWGEQANNETYFY